MSSMEEGSNSSPKQKLSCTKCFDALWFCYSPVHQMQQYYRLGVLDNCREKWSALGDCLMLKTKRASDVQEILESREKEKTHIWHFRSTKASSDNWRKLYGHLDEVDPEE
ncbi:hypothetical protein QN277_024689 [Acacia crassicarpa]|uniref:Uncharacterized protein n=1 Tax=Acacia crassicarpa TaxID=499986 RepID=A0AAE1K807_9FABA|nr:hypothetical protein QN277_024689 [Acacia crassicarpa]